HKKRRPLASFFVNTELPLCASRKASRYILFDVAVVIAALILCIFLYKCSLVDEIKTNSKPEAEAEAKTEPESQPKEKANNDADDSSEKQATIKEPSEKTNQAKPENPQQQNDSVIFFANRRVIISATVLISLLIIYFVCINVFINKLSNKNNREQVYTNLNSVIDWLDEGYEIAQKELSDKWMLLAKDEDVRALNQEAINNICETMKKEHNLDKMFITDKNGKILYSFSGEKDKANSIFKKIIPVIGRKIASERFGTAESWNSRIDSLMINTIGESFSDLLGESALSILKAFEKFDTVSEIELGNKRHLVFSTVIETPKNEQLILIIWQDSQSFSQDYLVNKIKDSQSLPENLRKVMLSMVPVHLDNQPYPPEITKYSFSRDITERVNYTKRPANFETNAGGQKFYGVGTMLNSIPNYVIFALQEE
ncbi:MAG: hypothetical protein IKO19_03850, partial [Candidatus Riflebacteria bacterium]|nr:hypothetical protein [Candidatus Riflebacteria bacterium]